MPAPARLKHGTTPRRIRLWVLAGIACLAFVTFCALKREEPSFAEQIPMLKGIRPVEDDMEIHENQGVGIPPVKVRSQLFSFHEKASDVIQKFREQLPQKPVYERRLSEGTIYSFGTQKKIGYEGVFVFKDKVNDAAVLVFDDGENKSSIGILEMQRVTWIDKITVWWAKATGR